MSFCFFTGRPSSGSSSRGLTGGCLAAARRSGGAVLRRLRPGAWLGLGDLGLLVFATSAARGASLAWSSATAASVVVTGALAAGGAELPAIAGLAGNVVIPRGAARVTMYDRHLATKSSYHPWGSAEGGWITWIGQKEWWQSGSPGEASACSTWG